MTSLLELQQAVNAACRRDLQSFVERVFHVVDPSAKLERAAYLDVLCDHLQQVAEGSSRRLLITIPPRHLKSITAAVALPAWVLGRNPAKKIIAVSYGQDLAFKHADDFRKVLRAPWYDRVFPGLVGSISRDTSAEVRTRRNGFRYATSLGGTLTGLGCDLLIIDDLMKASDAASSLERDRVQEFYRSTLLSRLNDKSTGQIIAIQQRLHEDDLAGYLIETGGFLHLNLPAIAEESQVFSLSDGRVFRRAVGDVLKPLTEPMRVLDELRQAMGERAFQAQYQQNPTPSDSPLIRWDRIQTYDEAPPRERLHALVQSWDTAMADSPKSDYSVGTTWGHDGQSWLLLDLVRVRLPYPELLAKVRHERRRWQPDTILVEKASTGGPLLDDLARDMRCLSEPHHHAPSCQRHAVTPRIGKEERLATQVDRLYTGKARFPTSAPWLADLKRELLGFPQSAHDDQVDSISQFLEWCVGRGGRSVLDRRRENRRR